MNSIDIVVLCIGLMTLSLVTVSIINRIQTRTRVIRQKIQLLRRRINELEELCASVEPLVETIQVPQCINEEVIQLIQSVQQLEPNATYMDVHLDQAKSLAKEFSNDRRTQPLFRLQSSDAAIAKNKSYLTEAARIIRRQHSLGAITASEMESYVHELTWAYLMVGVISHVGQGHKAVVRKDSVVAYTYYRKAQNMLINASADEQRRHRYIRELSEILKNKRPALSLELMPESDLNPTGDQALQLPQEEQPSQQTTPTSDSPPQTQH